MRKGGRWVMLPKPGWWNTEHWHPDTDIAQSWLVVEKMVEEGWLLTLAIYPGEAHAVFDKTDWNSPEGAKSASAAPEAICKAALAAKRGE